PPRSTLFPYTTLFRSEPGGLLLDGGLESAQALPLPRALAGPDVTGGLAQGLAEAEIGLGEELDALHLQLLGHLVEVDPHLGQLLDRKSTRLNSSHLVI